MFNSKKIAYLEKKVEEANEKLVISEERQIKYEAMLDEVCDKLKELRYKIESMEH